MPRLKVSAAAERTLDAWLDRLVKGEIRIQDLPLCVAAWFHAGEAYGRASRQHEIDSLTAEVNRLHYLAFHTPGERRDMLLARLDRGLATATEETWQQLEKDLAEMAGRQLNNHSIRTGRAADGDGVFSDHRREAA